MKQALPPVAAESAMPRQRGRSLPSEFQFRLYVTGSTPASMRAVVNARKLCEEHLHGRYDLEILNVADHVANATKDQVVAAPTLIRLWPQPLRRFIGDLSNTERLLAGLNLRRPVAAAD